MKKRTSMGLFTLLLASLFAFSLVKGEAQSDDKQTEKEKRRVTEFRMYDGGDPGLTRKVLDTLRTKKKRYGITRDEYLDKTGGVLANGHFEAWYPPGRVTVTHGMYLLELAEQAKRRFREIMGKGPDKKLCLITTMDFAEYLEKTGKEWWYYSKIKGDTLIFQPVYVLEKRTLGPIAISHEYSQWAIRELSRGNAPRWLEEGLASYISNEKYVLVDQLNEFRNMKLEMTPEEVEEILAKEEKREETRIAYYHAFKMVESLIIDFGVPKLAAMIDGLGKGQSLDEASRKSFGESYSKLLQISSNYEIDRKG